MPRFAILIHDHPFHHWDLLLEGGGACRTWRLLASPDSTCDEVRAEALSEHRLIYLDYEGPVSLNRGSVSRWDAGWFEWRIDRPEFCEALLKGSRWQGVIQLSKRDGDQWSFRRIHDASESIDSCGANNQ